MASVKEDFLEEDAEIRSQKFVLLSFLSPENVLENKDQYFFTEFVKQYEIDYKIRNLETFLVSTVRGINEKFTKEADRLELESPDLSGVAAACRTSRLNMAGILESYQAFVKDNKPSVTSTTIKEAFDDYLYKNQAALEEAFFTKNEFKTTIRGLKVRGVTGTHGEAVAMSKKLQRNDPIHNIFVGEVGKWLPWDPKPHQVQDQEYAEDQLNTLMKGYKNNEEAKDKFVSEQRKEAATGARRTTAPSMEPVVDMPVPAASPAAMASPVPVASATPASGEALDGWRAMFGDSKHADLAMERKAGGR